MAYGDGDELRGVAGWLGFFVVIMAVLTPLAAVALTAVGLYQDPDVAAAYGADWSSIQLLEWTLAGLTVAGAWFVAYRLTQKQVWSTVRITIAGIWLIGLGSLLVEFAGISLIADIPMSLLFEGVGPEMIRPIIFGVIWTGYFLRSRRVANTYGQDAAGDEAAAVFR